MSIMQMLVAKITAPIKEWNLNLASFDGFLKNYFYVGLTDGTPKSPCFSSDGLKLYFAGDSTNAIYQYSVSHPWDVSTATFEYKFNLSSLNDRPSVIVFKPDGSKFYVLDTTDDRVYQYDLTTDWELSSASYANKSAGVGTQDSGSQALAFKSDGSKMYMIGVINNTLYEYDLDTDWDVSTANYNNVSKDLSVQNGIGVSFVGGMFFKSDGLRMYVIDQGSGDYLNEYHLDSQSPWDISTASYQRRITVSPPCPDPAGLFFKSDGTRFYTTDRFTDVLFQFDLDDAWDVSTAEFIEPTTEMLDLGGQSPQDLFFKPDGTKLYIVNSYTDVVEQYDLDYGWDINTANYVQSFDVSNQELSPNGVFFKSDGSRMYIVGSVGVTGNNGDRVNEYELQTDWNISTASYVQNFDIGAQEVAPQSLAFSDDGLKMFVLGQSGDDVNEYDLDSQSPWDISTASYSQNLSISPPFSQPMGLCFSDSGRKMFITGYNADVIRRYDLSTPFDVSTAQYNHPNQFSTYFSDNTPRGVFFKPEGDKFFMIGSYNNKVYSYNIPAAPLGWADIGDAVSVRSDPISVSSTEVPAGIFFHPAGTKVYVSDSSRTITEQELSTPWDISSHGNVTHTFTPPTQSGQSYAEPTDLFFKPDGTSIFYVEYQSDKVVEHTLSTAWDLSSVSSTVNATLQAPSTETRLRGLYFSPNGKKMFIIGFNDDKLRKYTLSTAWDLTSATLDTTTAAIAASPLSLWFKPDGTKLYLTDNLSDSVKQWDLDTPWDISGVTFSNKDSDHFLGSLQIDNQPRPMFISNDGRHYYVGGGQNSTFFQFSLDQS